MTAKNPDDMRGEDWAGDLGDKWLANIDAFEGMIAPIGEALIDAAAPRPGEAALDIGCGGGQTTMALARAVGPDGTATGLDISAPLTMTALGRAATARVKNISFIVGDAGKVKLQPHAYDLLFSRFGVMFFSDPVAAFAHLHPAMKPSGRVQFACWAPPKENEWVSVVVAALSKRLQLPTPEPRAPGPFAFAEPDYVNSILTDAGYRNIEIDEWRGVQYLGGRGSTPASAANFALNALSVAKIAKAAPENIQTAVEQDLIEALSPLATPDGVAVKAFTWFVRAKP